MGKCGGIKETESATIKIKYIPGGEYFARIENKNWTILLGSGLFVKEK